VGGEGQPPTKAHSRERKRWEKKNNRHVLKNGIRKKKKNEKRGLHEKKAGASKNSRGLANPDREEDPFIT